MQLISERYGRSGRAARVIRQLWARAACGSLVAALAATLASAGHLGASDAPVARPFKGSAQGYITGQIPPNGRFLEMAGRATHLGRFTREEYAYLGADGSVIGTITFTAAKGDELWVVIDGAFTSATDVAGRYAITGGTGRFRGATGEAAFRAYTPDFVYAEVVFEGTVRY